MQKQPPTQKNSAALLDNWLSKSDEFARQQPTKAAVSAFGMGFIINLLPVGFIVGALTSIIFALARPILLFLGLMKACELCQTKSKLIPKHPKL